MPFDNKISKAIQIRIATDQKLDKVIKVTEQKLSIKLKSRDQTIDYLASSYLKNNQ